MLKDYFLVAKPWIVLANLIAAAGGFFLAGQGQLAPALLLPTLLGLCLVVASGCVFNNCIDRNIDRVMARTCRRALARGSISLTGSLVYATLLGLAGVSVLWLGTNPLSVAIVFAGFTVYVGVYSLSLKRTSASSTLIGSLAGAAPPLAAYCAVRNRFDLGAVLVLALFSLWQIPHSYAITIFRLPDYAAADIPVMSVTAGLASTKKQIIGHILAFTVAAQMLTFCGYTGYASLTVATVLGLTWLALAWSGRKSSDARLWAKKLYVFSIVTIFILSVMMSIDCTSRTLSAHVPL